MSNTGSRPLSRRLVALALAAAASLVVRAADRRPVAETDHHPRGLPVQRPRLPGSDPSTPHLDPDRAGSGGGLLTNWVITQTDRFAAAVSQRSIADWAGFWYTADFTLFLPSWFRGAPWETPDDFRARSPITHVGKVKTPLMLIEGEDDYRTPPSDGGEQMFRALTYRKVPTVLVRFPAETHDLSRSGRPRHRLERLQHIVGWFDKYLQGRQVETYDTKGG